MKWTPCDQRTLEGGERNISLAVLWGAPYLPHFRSIIHMIGADPDRLPVKRTAKVLLFFLLCSIFFKQPWTNRLLSKASFPSVLNF